MKEDKSTAYTIQTVNKALELLEAIAESSTGLDIAQLEKIAGLNRNKTFRLLATLSEKGLVDRDAIAGSYRLGICSVALGQKLIKNASVVNYSHPIIEQLARKHGEAVYMTVIRDDEVLFVDMVDCEHTIRTKTLVGRRFPFFTNAAGKVMKALDSWDLLEKMFRKRGRTTELPDLAGLASELAEIRTKGVAVDSGALGEGIISVAVAVKDYAGKVVGAITLIGPSFRMLAERLENEIIPSLLEGGELLSEKFGYAPA